MTILISLIIIMFVVELSTYLAYGKFLKNSEVLQYIKDYDPLEINSHETTMIVPASNGKHVYHDSNLIRTRNHKYISRTRFSFLSKYYISDLGVVPRWSNAHKVIKKLYETLKISES